MSTLTVSLPDPLAARLARAAQQRSVPLETIVQQALEQVLPQDETTSPRSVFERLRHLTVSDPESPTDLATNRAHMEGFGASRPA